jgi:isocitrate dehydrogenase kinase/phosphatase
MNKVNAIARTILDGFDKHYRLFRQISARAQEHFRNRNWEALARDSATRIRMYEQRVRETVEALERDHPEAAASSALWTDVKLAYIGLLLEHLQVECAETFYNSVACRVLHRRYYRNDYIFWRPTLNTDHLEGTAETYHCYYPSAEGLRRSLLEILTDAAIGLPFEDLRRDVRYLERAMAERHASGWQAMPNYQLQVLATPFYRSKAAYLVGREINGDQVRPLIIPLLQNEAGALYVDTLLTRRKNASILFSFTRAYFMTDMEVPSAYVSFLTSIMPTKSPVDLYAILGLQKHAKTLFYRVMQHHLTHSRDNFVIAPGIPGTVMLVFTLPSFPFVLKIIKDRFEPPKVTNREHVRERYTLVKFHDRVGRMADTLEYSLVAIPLSRIDPELLREMQDGVASSIEVDGDMLVIAHCYIERRMMPLNEYLAQATGNRLELAIDDYAAAIRELASANIFPGDMMQKNFGVTRFNRVVFYDYDEISYMTDCNFRSLPRSDDYFDDLSEEPVYSVQEEDVFPETFASFFFPNQKQRELFMRRNSDLVDPAFWRQTQEQIRAGRRLDVFPYPEKIRFSRRFGSFPRHRASAASKRDTGKRQA